MRLAFTGPMSATSSAAPVIRQSQWSSGWRERSELPRAACSTEQTRSSAWLRQLTDEDIGHRARAA
jgi:hypothetical protein